MRSFSTLPAVRPWEFSLIAIRRFSALTAFFALPLSSFATAVFMLLFAVTCLSDPEYRSAMATYLREPAVQSVLALAILSAVGCLWTIADFSEALHGLKKNLKLLFFPLMLPALTDARLRREVFYCFLAAVGLSLVLGTIKYHGQFDWGHKYSAAAVFKHHIDTNFLVAIFSFFAMHAVKDGLGRWQPLGYLFVFLSAYYVLFLSVGRTGYVVFGLLLLLFFMQRMRRFGFLLGVAALVGAYSLALSFPSGFQQRFLQTAEAVQLYKQGDVETSLGQRLQFFQGTWGLIQAKPFLGWGTGGFAPAYSNYVADSGFAYTDNPHNEYLFVWAELGVIGLFSLVFVFLISFIRSFWLPSPAQWYAQGVILSISVGSLANSWLTDTMQGYFFAMFMAWCFASLRTNRSYGIR